MRRCLLLTLISAAAGSLFVSPVSAQWYGSRLDHRANATYGCEATLSGGPFGGQQLLPTHQTSCTYHQYGYANSGGFVPPGPQPSFVVPSSGRIAAIRVRSGRSPFQARVRLTILTSSVQVDPSTGRDRPFTTSCCRARYVGRPFRPRPNTVTTKRVNVRVNNENPVPDRRLHLRARSYDGVALSAEGGGALPLYVMPKVGSYSTGTELPRGTPLVTGQFPRFRVGDRRLDGNPQIGIDLLLQWNFRR